MRSRGTRRSRAGRAGQLPASSAACSRQCGAEGPGCAPPLVRLPAFFYLVRDSCSIALTMPLQHVRGFLVFVRAVCVRSFEMALPKMYPIRISSFFLLAFKALWRLFSPYNSAPGTACEQVFICRLVSFASPAFNLCFLPHDLLFCLAALGHHLTSVAIQVLVSECLFRVHFLVVRRLVNSCCCQLRAPQGVRSILCPSYGWEWSGRNMKIWSRF